MTQYKYNLAARAQLPFKLFTYISSRMVFNKKKIIHNLKYYVEAYT